MKRAPTTAYHPKLNGMVERFHRQFKNSLRARLASSDWSHHLPWVLLRLRIAPKEMTNAPAAKVVYDSTLTIPRNFLARKNLSLKSFWAD